MWLFVTFFLFLFCPQVNSNRWSVFNSFARKFAEKLLTHQSEFPRNLEGFELGFINVQSSKPLAIVYNITPNNNSWLFITPCSNFKYTIIIQSLVSDNDDKLTNKTYDLSKGHSSEWYSKVTKIDMRYSSGFGENITIENWKRQEIHIENLKLGIMRLFINSNNDLPSVYMIRQYSGRIDAFYPRIPPEPSVRVCVVDAYRSTLSIYVSRAFNTDFYCATFNLDEDLPNFCTAQLRIDKFIFNNKKIREKLNIRRPNIFDEFNTFGNKPPILQSEFRCFKTNRFDVTLEKIFTKKLIYINIYAVNTATEFTDSYQPVRYKWGDYQDGCDSVGRKIRMDKEKSHLWVLGNETVFFNITIGENNKQPTRLLYQSCISNQGQSLQVFERESQAPICVEIAHNRAKALCEKLKSGQYRFQHTILSRPNNTFPVGQMFLTGNIKAFPHLDCNKSQSYSLNLHRVPLKYIKEQYYLNINFSRVPSTFAISYYFYILEFPTKTNNNYSTSESMARIRQKVQTERNFCKFIYDQKQVRLPIHKVTLKGQGCESKLKNEYVKIPGLFYANYTYALLVYFGKASDWMPDVQFYSNVIFTMSSEEEVF